LKKSWRGRRIKFMPVPKYDELFEPLLQAIQQLGGSASVAEQEDTVAAILHLTEKEIAEIHRGTTTKLSYRLAWARNYLKRFGILENSTRGVWSLTPQGSKHKSIDKEQVKRFVRAAKSSEASERESSEIEEVSERWEDQLLEIVKAISPAAFERLCQRILRESGFIHVEITGRTGDGGIDGKGVVRVGGLLSFHVIFQCKRYKGSVGSSLVRDFRGAMVGRADKGLLITTGSFTRDARIEAQRDGAPPIDLVDGDELVEKLKELRIGIEVRQKVIEEIAIREDYFQTL
jgi:restriction system protein